MTSMKDRTIYAKLLTLDANVFVAALKGDEEYSDECAEILHKLPGRFVLVEPSVIYQEVCGTLARRVGPALARRAEKLLNAILHPRLVLACDASFCKAAYILCYNYNIYSVDALYLKAALDAGAILVSLDKRDFIDRVKRRNPPIEVYHVAEFPY